MRKLYLLMFVVVVSVSTSLVVAKKSAGKDLSDKSSHDQCRVGGGGQTEKYVGKDLPDEVAIKTIGGEPTIIGRTIGEDSCTIYYTFANDKGNEAHSTLFQRLDTNVWVRHSTMGLQVVQK